MAEKVPEQNEERHCHHEYFRVEDLPAGFKFKPTDEELISFFLKSKVINLPMPPSEIQELTGEVFYSKHPKDIVENMLKGREWFYFIVVPCDLLDLLVRKVGDGLGFWKSSEDRIPIHGEDGVPLQAHKTLWTFFTTSQVQDKNRNPKKTHWQMMEYRLSHQPDKAQGYERKELQRRNFVLTERFGTWHRDYCDSLLADFGYCFVTIFRAILEPHT
ncbi:hypothetical protein Ancab_036013 [Ancistrocladus abbreviatus]